MTLQEKIDHARSLSYEYKKADFSIYDKLIEYSDSDRKFLTYVDSKGSESTHRYSEFTHHCLATAAFFQNEGLQVGDKIATISHNHWHTVVHYFAAWICGLVPVPVNLGEDDQRIEYILKNAEVKLALVRDIYLDRINEVISGASDLKAIKVITCGDDASTFEANKTDFKKEVFDNEVDAFIVFTSGTTGNPKGVVLSQQNLLEDCLNIANWHEMDSETTMMCVLPIHHVNGTVVTLITPFLKQAKTILNQKFSVANFFDKIEKYEVDIVSTVPTLLQYLNSYYESNPIPENIGLKHVICGAGPLTINVAETFEDLFEIPIIHGYGLSETTCYSCYLPLGQDGMEHRSWLADHGYPSIGLAIPANEMAIHDEKGNPVAEQERGEIVIRGVNVMKGYFNNPEANESAFQHGWFRSGDEGFYINDDDGNSYFFITGRLKELIIRGGINLAPLEIDEVLNQIPGVETGIAVGFENDWYGEEVGAYVQVKEGADVTVEEVQHFCEQRLPYSKCPKIVIFGDDIPVTSTGKYQRRKVVHLFERWRKTHFK